MIVQVSQSSFVGFHYPTYGLNFFSFDENSDFFVGFDDEQTWNLKMPAQLSKFKVILTKLK